MLIDDELLQWLGGADYSLLPHGISDDDTAGSRQKLLDCGHITMGEIPAGFDYLLAFAQPHIHTRLELIDLDIRSDDKTHGPVRGVDLCCGAVGVNLQQNAIGAGGIR